MSKKGAIVEPEEKLSLKEMEGALEISAVVERRVNALMNLHDKYLEINKKYQEEARALERKYQTLYTPIFDKRETIINGKYEPTDEEAKYGEQEEEKKDERPKGDEKGIPDFWSQALQNDGFISRSVFDADAEALEYLTDIRVNNFETNDTNGFELIFHFAENPYFTNKTLTKKYFLEMDDMFGEFNLEHAEGCTIDWKAGKNLAVKMVKKKVKSKGKNKKQAGAAKTVNVPEPCETFFNFFTPPKAEKDEEEDEEDEEEEEDENQQLMEIDFEMGCKIKDLVPIAVLWFTGDAAEFDEDGFDFGGFGDEDDEDDLDEDDEDDEEDEEPKGRGGRGGKAGGKGHAFAPPTTKGAGSNIPQPQQPECKQQ